MISETTERPESHVDAAMNGLQKQLAELHELALSLRSRLEPLLLERTALAEAKNPETPNEVEASSFVRALLHASDQSKSTSTILSRLLRDLEI